MTDTQKNETNRQTTETSRKTTEKSGQMLETQTKHAIIDPIDDTKQSHYCNRPANFAEVAGPPCLHLPNEDSGTSVIVHAFEYGRRSGA